MDDDVPLHVAGAGTDGGAVAATSLTQATLQAVFDRAVGLWQSADPSRTALLNTVQVSIADYSGSVLGMASSSGTIRIDSDAAGFGWSTNAWSVNPGRIDLLSVVSHELGHLIGLDHRERDHRHRRTILIQNRLIPTFLCQLLSFPGSVLVGRKRMNPQSRQSMHRKSSWQATSQPTICSPSSTTA